MSMVAPLGMLGKYEIRGTLGRGAMGTVHDGWDPAIDRRVAIKTIRLPPAGDPDTEEALSRFKREAQAAGRLSHPNIVGAYDYGESSDLAYIVMEFVDGTTLRDRLDRDERLPLAETLRIMGDVLAGLAYSHGRGVVHRDIKPANVMLTAEGRAKITDFGIARIESSSMTQAGTVLGTPAYMSPEQFMGLVVDRRTDIYSAGVMLYVLLTGKKPFEGGLTAIMHKVLNTVPPWPSERSDTVPSPRPLDAVVARAMARRPEDRFSSAGEFAAALQGAMAPEQAGPDATIMAPRRALQPAPAARRASPMLLAGSGAALLLAAGAAAWLLAPGWPRPQAVAALPSPAAPPRSEEPVTLPRPPDPLPAPQADAAVPAAPPVFPPQPAPPPAQAAPPAPSLADMLAQNRIRIGPGVQQAPAQPPQATLSPPQATVPPPQATPAPQQQAMAVLPPPVVVPTPPVPVVARPPAAIRAALAPVLAETRCTFASAEVSDAGTATITGLVGDGEPEAALRRGVEEARPAATEWRAAASDNQYCRALDLLRPFGPATGARVRLSLAGGKAVLANNDLLALDVSLNGIAGHLQVFYLQNDGLAFQRVPSPDNPTRTYSSGSRVELGRARGALEGWLVGPPFGTDMVFAIVSSAPLFPQPRLKPEPATVQIRELAAAIEDLRRRGGTLAADAVVFDIRP